MASGSHNVSSSVPPSAGSHSKAVIVNNNRFAPEPEGDKAKRAIWKSQVLIPFQIKDRTHAFLGPYCSLKSFPKV